MFDHVKEDIGMTERLAYSSMICLNITLIIGLLSWFMH